MKKTDFITAILFTLIVSLSFFSLENNKASGSISSCIPCTPPLCGPGQILSSGGGCSECPKCIDINTTSSGNDSCKCLPGERFDGKTCLPKLFDAIECVTLFDPVCGCNRVTYSNKCFANADGVKQVTQGECDFTTICRNPCGVKCCLLDQICLPIPTSGSTSGTTFSSFDLDCVPVTCASDRDCPLGTCPDGQSYQQSSCLNGIFTHLNFFVDPCLFLSSSSSGEVNPPVLSEGFTGLWRGMVLNCSPTTSNKSLRNETISNQLICLAGCKKVCDPNVQRQGNDFGCICACGISSSSSSGIPLENSSSSSSSGNCPVLVCPRTPIGCKAIPKKDENDCTICPTYKCSSSSSGSSISSSSSSSGFLS